MGLYVKSGVYAYALFCFLFFFVFFFLKLRTYISIDIKKRWREQQTKMGGLQAFGIHMLTLVSVFFYS